MKNLSRVLLILVALNLTSCRWFTSDATDNFLRNFKVPSPPGSPVFKKGFKHGCSSILYSRSNFFYRTMFKYEYDTSLRYNKDYSFGYKRGYNACFLAIITSKVPSFDKALFPMASGNDIGMGFYNQTNYDHTSGMFDGILNMGFGGNVNGVVENLGSGDSVLDSNPIWAGNSKGQFFGQ